jgi:hypothetical protein
MHVCHCAIAAASALVVGARKGTLLLVQGMLCATRTPVTCTGYVVSCAANPAARNAAVPPPASSPRSYTRRGSVPPKKAAAGRICCSTTTCG